MEKHVIHPDHPEQTIQIIVDLSEETKLRLITLLKQFSNLFAWQPTYMIGVDRKVIEHSLDIVPRSPLIKQKIRSKHMIGTKKSMRKSKSY